MKKRMEIGLGSTTGTKNNSFALGKTAAQQALSRITTHDPSLVLVFASVNYDLSQVLKGIRTVTRKTPLIGTTTAGEIADKYQEGTIVVLILASPHLRVAIGVGEHVSVDPQQSMNEAITQCRVDEYLTPRAVWEKKGGFHLKKQNDLLALMFSPGSTKVTPSSSQTLLGVLKRKTQNRLPVFGGSSGDNLTFEQNYQFANDRVLVDSVVLCIIETELKFGLAVDHGFTPTDRRATVTKAEGHRVIDLDQRPAAHVYAEMTRKTVDELRRQQEQLTQYTKAPLGQCTDYGEYVLKVPDFILDDNSIVFTPLVFENTVLTLMEGSQEKTLAAAKSAVDKAIIRGRIEDSALVLLFSCVLRRILFKDEARREVEIVKREVGQAPVVGFYTYGEQNMSDDNVLTYYNETASVLVFGNELNDVARVNRENERLYAQLEAAIAKLERANEETRQKAEELSIARDQAQEANRLKSAFLTTMSHELRTPLTSILGFTDILLQGLSGPLNAEQAKQLGMVRNSARHLLDLINDILDVSKIEAGEVEIISKPFDMREAIEKVVRSVTPLAEEKNLTVTFDIGPEVGRITSDRRRVEQILINLLNNAIKFTDKGAVRVECRVNDNRLVSRVVDTGIGIKPEDMDKLFQAFRQIDIKPPRRRKGTGLGLSICKNLVEMLGGEIWAESEGPGKGSTFTFTLPMG